MSNKTATSHETQVSTSSFFAREWAYRSKNCFVPAVNERKYLRGTQNYEFRK